MNVVDEYIAAFGRCYPHKQLAVHSRYRDGVIKFRVIIDKDPGDIMLTEADMRSATRLFNRGR